jgi:hypothetical protein
MIKDNVLLYNDKKYNILKYHIKKIQYVSYDYIFDITIDSSLYIDIDTELDMMFIFVDNKTYFIYNIILDYFIDSYGITSTYIFKGVVFDDYTNLVDDKFKFPLHYKKQLLRKMKLKRL